MLIRTINVWTYLYQLYTFKKKKACVWQYDIPLFSQQPTYHLLKQLTIKYYVAIMPMILSTTTTAILHIL